MLNDWTKNIKSMGRGIDLSVERMSSLHKITSHCIDAESDSTVGGHSMMKKYDCIVMSLLNMLDDDDVTSCSTRRIHFRDFFLSPKKEGWQPA